MAGMTSRPQAIVEGSSMGENGVARRPQRVVRLSIEHEVAVGGDTPWRLRAKLVGARGAHAAVVHLAHPFRAARLRAPIDATQCRQLVDAVSTHALKVHAARAPAARPPVARSRAARDDTPRWGSPVLGGGVCGVGYTARHRWSPVLKRLGLVPRGVLTLSSKSSFLKGVVHLWSGDI